MDGFGTLPPEAAALCPVGEADVTFLDAGGVVRFFSAYRIFSRSAGCLNRDVLECHKEESRPGVARLLAEFREGWRDSAQFLNTKLGRNVDVLYLAVRDSDATYLGCVEVARWSDSD